jgi:signal transduction histidine kinase
MGTRLMVRVIAPFGAISVLVFLLGATAAWYVNDMHKEVSDVITLNVASVRAAEELDCALRDVRSHLKDYLHTGDPRHLEPVRGLRRETDRWMQEAERLATTQPEEELMRKARRWYDEFFARFDRLPAPAVPSLPTREGGSPGKAEGWDLVNGVLTGELLPPVRAYLDLNEETASRSTERNRVMAVRMALLALVLGTTGAVAGLLGGYAIARRISRSIVQLSVPIRDAAGKLTEVVGPLTLAAGRDFGELEASLQKVAGQIGMVVERLQSSQREVLRAEQLAAVGQMAAGMAHELRNPLMAMKVLVQPVAERNASARQLSPECPKGTARNGATPHPGAGLSEEDLAVLNEEITRLDHTIQGFLDFARPPQLERRPFEVRGLAEQTALLVSRRAEQQGVRVSCDLPDQPVVAEADIVQVRQVLLNLLLNALDATPTGGEVRVEILLPSGPDLATTHGSCCGKGALTVRVSDTGCGLPPDLGRRIFEPFVSTKTTGMGLGLSICSRIVEAHGGEIDAAVRPEGGSVFAFRLPLLASSRPPA